METNYNLPKRPPKNEPSKNNSQSEQIKRIEDIKNENITLFEKIESKEVEEIIKTKQIGFNIATYLLSLTTFFVLLFTIPIYEVKFFAPILYAILVAFIGEKIKRKILKKYYDLLKITRKNDNIRHEEKVRARERERLNKIENGKLTARNIKNSIKDYEELNNN